MHEEDRRDAAGTGARSWRRRPAVAVGTVGGGILITPLVAGLTGGPFTVAVFVLVAAFAVAMVLGALPAVLRELPPVLRELPPVIAARKADPHAFRQTASDTLARPGGPHR